MAGVRHAFCVECLVYGRFLLHAGCFPAQRLQVDTLMASLRPQVDVARCALACVVYESKVLCASNLSWSIVRLPSPLGSVMMMMGFIAGSVTMMMMMSFVAKQELPLLHKTKATCVCACRWLYVFPEVHATLFNLPGC